MDKHEIVSDLKRVAELLGRKPSRDDYLAHGKYTRNAVEHCFGLWTEAVKASFGVEKYVRKEKEYDPIEPAIASYNKDKLSIKKIGSIFPIVIYGDTHFPFVDVNALTMAHQITAEIKPKIVIQIGDLNDCFAQGKFPRTHNTYSPKDEAELAYKMASEMWASVKSIVPSAKCYQMHGNHTVRGIKRILEVAPSLEHVIDIDKYLTFEGVELIKDPREELVIGDVVFTHGWLSQLGAHRDYLMRNVSVGHSHTGGVSYKKVSGKVLWELNAGYLGDPNSKALSYTPTRSTRWTHGLGVIDEFGPRFIPID